MTCQEEDGKKLQLHLVKISSWHISWMFIFYCLNRKDCLCFLENFISKFGYYEDNSSSPPDRGSRRLCKF